MLNAINNNKTVWRNAADSFGDRGNIHPHSGNWRGMQNSGNARIWCDRLCIIIGCDQAARIIMGDQLVRLARNAGPSGTGTARSRMFHCRAQNDTISSSTKAGIHYQSENQFGATFPDKKLTIRCIHKYP